MTHTEIKTIASLKRLKNSTNGNPRYDVAFTDGTSAKTENDAACAYVIPNSEYQAPNRVRVHFDNRGDRIQRVSLL